MSAFDNENDNKKNVKQQQQQQAAVVFVLDGHASMNSSDTRGGSKWESAKELVHDMILKQSKDDDNNDERVAVIVLQKGQQQQQHYNQHSTIKNLTFLPKNNSNHNHFFGFARVRHTPGLFTRIQSLQPDDQQDDEEVEENSTEDDEEEEEEEDSGDDFCTGILLATRTHWNHHLQNSNNNNNNTKSNTLTILRRRIVLLTDAKHKISGISRQPKPLLVALEQLRAMNCPLQVIFYGSSCCSSRQQQDNDEGEGEGEDKEEGEDDSGADEDDGENPILIQCQNKQFLQGLVEKTGGFLLAATASKKDPSIRQALGMHNHTVSQAPQPAITDTTSAIHKRPPGPTAMKDLRSSSKPEDKDENDDISIQVLSPPQVYNPLKKTILASSSPLLANSADNSKPSDPELGKAPKRPIVDRHGKDEDGDDCVQIVSPPAKKKKSVPTSSSPIVIDGTKIIRPDSKCSTADDDDFVQVLSPPTKKKNVDGDEPPLDKDESHDDESPMVVASNLTNPNIHYPHKRSDCGVHNFERGDPILYCNKCYCLVCDIPAINCTNWKVHCRERPKPKASTLYDEFVWSSSSQNAATAPQPPNANFSHLLQEFNQWMQAERDGRITLEGNEILPTNTSHTQEVQHSSLSNIRMAREDYSLRLTFSRRFFWNGSDDVPLDEWLDKTCPSKWSSQECAWIQVENTNPSSPGYHSDRGGDENSHRFYRRAYMPALDKLHAMIQVGKRIPQKEKDACVASLLETAKAQGYTVGKWMLFVPSSRAKGVWNKVARATVLGSLGCSAKISPAANAQETVVCCVYVQDCTIHQEVKRVLLELRDNLGLEVTCGFKPDFYTDLNIYQKNVWRLKPTLYSVQQVFDW